MAKSRRQHKTFKGVAASDPALTTWTLRHSRKDFKELLEDLLSEENEEPGILCARYLMQVFVAVACHPEVSAESRKKLWRLGEKIKNAPAEVDWANLRSEVVEALEST